MRLLAYIILAVALVGCAHLPKVRLGKVEASAPKDVGKPATAVSDTATVTIPLPKDTVIEVPQPSQNPTAVASPVKVTLPEPTVMTMVQEHQAATTGTVDTTVAVRKADNDARMPLLYASIAAAVGVVVFMFMHYPTPAMLCGAASVVFFIAWQAAGLPAWFWIIGAVAVTGGIALWIGHERGELFAKKS